MRLYDVMRSDFVSIHPAFRGDNWDEVFELVARQAAGTIELTLSIDIWEKTTSARREQAGAAAMDALRAAGYVVRLEE